MIDIEVTGVQALNMDALDAELRAAFGSQCSGLSVRGRTVVAHLVDGVTEATIARAYAIILEHDPAILTDAQDAELRRQQRLMQKRKAVEEMRENDPQAAQKQLDWLVEEIQDLKRQLGLK